MAWLTAGLAWHPCAQADNANPTVTFTTNTNQTNPAGKKFALQLFAVSDYTNLRGLFVTSKVTNVSINTPPVTNNGAVVFSNIVTYSSTNIYSNDTVTVAGSFTGLGGGTRLINGLVFNPGTGLLLGTPNTNFILSFNDLLVETTNRTWSTTNIQTNRVVTVFSNGLTNPPRFQYVFATNIESATNITPSAFVSPDEFRLVFQSPAQITNFEVTNMLANATATLPATNGIGLQYGYQLVSGDGSLAGNLLSSTGMLPVVLRVSLTPTDDTQQMWSSNSTNLTITKIDPAVVGFGFATNTNLPIYTLTNLVFGSNTPLLVTNSSLYQPVFTANPPAPRQIFYSNHPTIPNLQIPYFRALGGTGSVNVTATVPGTNATLTITFTQAPTPIITMLGVFSNNNSNPAGGEYTNTNPAVTTLPLLAYSSANYGVGFSSSDTNVARITNGNTLVMVASGTSTISATNLFLNTNNYILGPVVTNKLVVNWPSPAAPLFTSTNRQDGVQGIPFTYFLKAGPNTNAFAISYGATNLAPGLVFVAPNKIVGTPTTAGLFRMQLTATNTVGTTTNVLTSFFAPGATLSVTNAWSLQVSMGTGTDPVGTYNIANLPTGIGLLTNSNSGTPPVLVLTNVNTNPANPASGPWFAGVTNLAVVFSSAQAPVTSSISLNIRPVAPVLNFANPVNGSPLQFSPVSGTVTPAGVSNIAGYPLFYRSSNLPSGLTLNPTSGVVSGTPQLSGTRTAQLWVSNSVGISPQTNVVFSIGYVSGYPCEIPMAGLFPGQTGTFASSNLPPGLRINPYSGLVSGIPQAVGNLSWTVTLATSSGILTNTTNSYFGPPVPVAVLPSPLPLGRVGQPYTMQPWVTGPGWAWAGADPLNQVVTNSWWSSRIVVSNGSGGVVTNGISSNANGRILATTQGLTFTNSSATNTLALLWGSALPSAWPWQATLRLRVPATNLTNGLASPFLGMFRAQTPFSTNYYDQITEAYLDSFFNVVQPEAFYTNSSVSWGNLSLGEVGTNEIAVRLSYDTNGGNVVMAINTNPVAWTNFSNVLTNTNLNSVWSLTNGTLAFRVWAGFSASGQAVTNGQVVARAFALIPGGVGFAASNLPLGLAIDSNNGTVYGTPSTSGTFTNVVITVTNASGTNSKTSTIIIVP